MNEPTRFARTFGIAAIAVVAGAGCATVYGPPPTDQLAVADAAVADATAADAARFAASNLAAAQRKLTRAHQALRAGDDTVARELAEEAEVRCAPGRHARVCAYLAWRRAAIATEAAQLKAAESSIATADAERDRIRLEARTRGRGPRG